MKTFKEYKDQIAVKRGYKNWNDFVHRSSLDEYGKCRQHLNKIYIHQDEEDKPITWVSCITYAVIVGLQFILAMVFGVILELAVAYLLGPFADYDFLIGWISSGVYMGLVAWQSDKWTEWILRVLRGSNYGR